MFCVATEDAVTNGADVVYKLASWNKSSQLQVNPAEKQTHPDFCTKESSNSSRASGNMRPYLQDDPSDACMKKLSAART